MWETVKPTSNKQIETTACNNRFLYTAISRKVVGEKRARDNPER